MVVPAGDSYSADLGFADDAPDAMPDFSDDAMPMDGDIAALPEEVFADGEAPPEPEPFSVESLALTPEQLAAFREHVSAELSPQLESQFAEREQKWDEQRQSLQSKVDAYDRDRLKASAWYSAANDVIGQILGEIGADQTQQDAIKFRVQELARQRLSAHAKKLAYEQTQTQQVQTAQTELHAQFQSEVERVRTLMHAHATSMGLDPTNATINTEFDELVVAAAEAYFDNPQSAKLQKAFEAAKAMHKKRVTEMGEQIKRRKAAKPAADALDRQRGRGPQNLGRGAGGSTPPNPTDVVNKAWELYPDNERARATYVREQLPR